MAAPGTNSDIYRPLDPESRNIRLLTIHPGAWNDRLLCQLSVVCLDDDIQYDALSYAWGEPVFDWPIFLDGRLHHVTANLYAALRRLRQPNRARVIWIDALCINQSDCNERNHQVNMMSFIYSRTAEAFFFLGDYVEGVPTSSRRPGITDTDSLAESTSRGNHQEENISREQVTVAVTFLHKLSSNEHIATSQEEANSTTFVESMKALRALMDSPWWKRIWTIQEAALPPKATVLYGSIHVPWSLFDAAAKNLYSHYKTCCRGLGNTGPIRRFYMEASSIGNLRSALSDGRSKQLNLLRLFRHRQASDPRDKVYALLGLVRGNRLEAETYADYSLDSMRIYTNLTVKLIGSTNDLYPLLRHAELGRRSDLPTWVTDWSAGIQEGYSASEVYLMRTYYAFNASPGRELSMYLSSPSVLSLQGLVVDEISMLGSHTVEDMKSNRDSVKQFKDLILYEERRFHPYVSSGNYEDAFRRLLVSDSRLGRDGISIRRAIPSDFEAPMWGSWSGQERCLNGREILSRKLFATRNGYIGHGPRDMELGDKVYILFGGRVPFVLRPIESSSSSFHYIGHAYVQGIMDGEALQHPKNEVEIVSLV